MQRFNKVQKNCKKISADEADVKQQEIKELVAVSYISLRSTLNI